MKSDDATTSAVKVVFISCAVIAAIVFAGVIVLPVAVVGFIIWAGYKYFNKAPPKIAPEDFYRAAIVQLQHIPDEDAYVKAVSRKIVRGHKTDCPTTSIWLAYTEITAELYKIENPRYLKPPPASGIVEEAKYREYVSQQLDKSARFDLLDKAIEESFARLEKVLPPAARVASVGDLKDDDDYSATISLSDLLEPSAITEVIGSFYDPPLIQSKLLQPLRDQIDRNLHDFSKVPFTEETRNTGNLVMPEKFKGTLRQAVPVYLHDTPFTVLFDAAIPFALPETTRFSGHWIVAPPNRGKSVLLSHMVMQDIEKDASIILMDSKGDLIKPFKELASIKDRLVILEPSEDYPLAINPLDLGASTTHTVAFLEYVFSSLLESEPTPLQGTLFRSILIALKATPHATFADFRRILVDGYEPYAEYIKKLDSDDQDFFFKGEFGSKTYEQTKQQLLWRIRDLTTRTPLLRNSFRAVKTKINIGQLMDERKIIIIDTSKALLDDAGSEFLSRMFIAMVRAAADQRSRLRNKDKVPCYFYIDEAHTAISRDTKLAGILTECRSQKIAMVLAHQSTSQITNPLTLAALSDCAIRFANSDEEASQLAPRLRTTPDFLRSLPIGTFAAFVRDFTTAAVPLKIPFIDVTALAKLSSEQQTALRRQMRERYAFAKQELTQPEPPADVVAQPPPSIDPLAAQKQ